MAIEVGANAWNRYRVTSLGETQPWNAGTVLAVTDNGKVAQGIPFIGMGIVGAPHQASKSLRLLALENPNAGLMQVNKMKGDVYGGLTEYSREVLEMGRRYHLPIDPHPSSEAYYVFYKDYIKKFLSSNGILLDKDPNQNITDLYKKYFDFEYHRFKVLSDFESMDFNFIHNKTRDIIISNVWEYDLIKKAFKNEKQIMGLW